MQQGVPQDLEQVPLGQHLVVKKHPQHAKTHNNKKYYSCNTVVLHAFSFWVM